MAKSKDYSNKELTSTDSNMEYIANGTKLLRKKSSDSPKETLWDYGERIVNVIAGEKGLIVETTNSIFHTDLLGIVKVRQSKK